MEVRKYSYLTGVQTYKDATLAIDMLSVKEFSKFLVCDKIVWFFINTHLIQTLSRSVFTLSLGSIIEHIQPVPWFRQSNLRLIVILDPQKLFMLQSFGTDDLRALLCLLLNMLCLNMPLRNWLLGNWISTWETLYDANHPV